MFLVLGPHLQKEADLRAKWWCIEGASSSNQHQSSEKPWPSPALIRKLVQSKQMLTSSLTDEPEMQLQRTLRNDWYIPENKISLNQVQSASWSPEVWFSHRWEEARWDDLIQEGSLISQALPTCFTNYQRCSWGFMEFSRWVLWCKLLLKTASAGIRNLSRPRHSEHRNWLLSS